MLVFITMQYEIEFARKTGNLYGSQINFTLIH